MTLTTSKDQRSTASSFSVDLHGVEVSAQYFFDFLPGAMSGFGVQGAFTLADSEIKGDDPLAGNPPGWRFEIQLHDRSALRQVRSQRTFDLDLPNERVVFQLNGHETIYSVGARMKF